MALTRPVETRMALACCDNKEKRTHGAYDAVAVAFSTQKTGISKTKIFATEILAPPHAPKAFFRLVNSPTDSERFSRVFHTDVG